MVMNLSSCCDFRSGQGYSVKCQPEGVGGTAKDGGTRTPGMTRFEPKTTLRPSASHR